MFRSITTLALTLILFSVATPQAEAAIQVGMGAHYWTSLDSIDINNVDDDGFSTYLSILFNPEYLLRVQVDIERLEAGYRGALKDVYAPSAYLVLGKSLYAAAGIGAYFSDGDFHEDEFYALRVGWELNLFEAVYLDLNANYRFDDWGNDDEVLEDIDTDTITLGGAIRVEF
ncbi:MAG: hypothetical protein ISS35_07420 [Kiritimatiellae bacterium]|nr:hypothetical protein [Kiritimatiellia bacterium]